MLGSDHHVAPGTSPPVQADDARFLLVMLVDPFWQSLQLSSIHAKDGLDVGHGLLARHHAIQVASNQDGGIQFVEQINECLLLLLFRRRSGPKVRRHDREAAVSAPRLLLL